MPRLTNISKYCVSRCSGAAASSKVGAMLLPCRGICCTPCTKLGSGRPATSSTVAATSITWLNCVRTSPRDSKPRGQCTTVPLRVPPQCEATCFVHW
jgi:hypothetical protein